MDAAGGGAFKFTLPALVLARAAHRAQLPDLVLLVHARFPSRGEADVCVHSVGWVCFNRRGTEHNQAFKAEP